ncbi:MAG TPA: hypothetical protein VJP79_09290 [Nitrososphaera sp.]|nr:hypothetical protein [Nitrososphaera sp.]
MPPFSDDLTTSSSPLFWFSHRARRYQIESSGFENVFTWQNNNMVMWDWDRCSISVGRLLKNGKIRFVVRSETNRNSEFIGSKPVSLRFMLAIDAGSIQEPWEEEYSITSRRKSLASLASKKYSRWVFSLDGRYWIWEWARKGKSIKSSRLYKLYEAIRKSFEAPGDLHNYDDDNNKILRAADLDATTDSKVFPVIYQPAVDSLGNFLREMHLARKTLPDGSRELEVSLVFNNEQLRKFSLFGILDKAYREFRLQKYGRIFDIETFTIRLAKAGDLSQAGNYFKFKNIYSDRYGLVYDTIHGDPAGQPRPVKYFLNSQDHPIVFVNTSNHAMAEFDNNTSLWKWEYVPWDDKAPIKVGTLSRKQLDERYQKKLAKADSAGNIV